MSPLHTGDEDIEFSDTKLNTSRPSSPTMPTHVRSHRTKSAPEHPTASDSGTMTRRPLLSESRPDSAASGMLDANDGTARRHLSFSRMTYNLPAFNEEFDKIPDRRRRIEPCGAGTAALEKVAEGCCSRSSMMRRARSILPILGWGFNYNVRNDLLADIISGITIVVFHVPQSMGYSLIAQVPPVYGLYSAFFPALVYALMGTSKQCAIGLFAVISLMTGSLVSQTQKELKEMNMTYENVDIAVMVSFLIGIYQLVFGFMQMGFVSVYLSEQLVSGFTTAASLYVFTSQLPFLFGCHLPHRSGPLALINSYVDLFAEIETTNVTALIISVVCCLVLIFVKFWVNPRFIKKTGLNIPLPIELVLVIVGTIVSHFLDLNVNNHVDIVGPIPTGLPMPSAPKWELLSILAKRSIPLAIVAYTLTISVGKIFANRHNYNIDPNQELLALGTTNLIGSMFFCLPSAASLSRSAVQESSGGKTQLVSLINCVGILFVLYFAGPLLEKLPNCILAAIIAIALKSLIWQFKDFVRYWKVSKLDSSIWLITFFAVVLLDVDLGLYVGLGYSLLTLIYKSQRPRSYMLGSINKSDVYVPVKKYASATKFFGIQIYQFCGPLHFANIEYFKNDLIRKTGVSVNEVVARRAKLEKRAAKESIKRDDPESARAFEYGRTSSLASEEERATRSLPTHIIIDCSMFSYIDTAGVSQLKATVQEYESIGIKTFLTGLATHVDKMLERDNFYKEVPPHHVYITIHDAVHHAQEEQLGAEVAVIGARDDESFPSSQSPASANSDTDSYMSGYGVDNVEPTPASFEEKSPMIFEKNVQVTFADTKDGRPKLKSTDSPEKKK